jgi:hypothetical protein
VKPPAWLEVVDEPSTEPGAALFRVKIRQCSQCGKPFTERACGPTHAVVLANIADAVGKALNP